MGDRAGIAASLSNLGVVAYEQGDFDAAFEYLDESVALKRELGDQTSAAIPLGTLGAIAVEQGDFDQARIMLEESLQLKREVGDRGVSL